ncbi:hypothetical protein, partial [uncultured Catenibacterium sp.]|uniref:hypothetical protein n=1 Tax=uncultured Catenibacterium sp. TaxID=286142 RepID=UPI00262425FE
GEVDLFSVLSGLLYRNEWSSISGILTNYTHWYFGHFHVDKELWRNQTAVFNTLYELESHHIMRQWNTYEG